MVDNISKLFTILSKRDSRRRCDGDQQKNETPYNITRFRHKIETLWNLTRPAAPRPARERPSPAGARRGRRRAGQGSAAWRTSSIRIRSAITEITQLFALC